MSLSSSLSTSTSVTNIRSPHRLNGVHVLRTLKVYGLSVLSTASFPHDKVENATCDNVDQQNGRNEAIEFQEVGGGFPPIDI